MRNVLVASVMLAMLNGCIFVPKEVNYFDEKCQVFSKKAVLDTETAVRIADCRDASCGFALAGAGLVSAASLVVSGSIVVVKNAVYWQELKGNCKTLDTDSSNRVHHEETNASEGNTETQSDIQEIERY